MVDPRIGLSPQVREQVSRALSEVLGTQFILYIKTLKFHWNVMGHDFKPLHLFFEEQYEQMLDLVDEVAERIRMLGHHAPATATEYLQLAKINEEPGKNPSAQGMLKALLDDHEATIRLVREHVDMTAQVGDMGTNNFLCDVLEKHEKMAWMLRVSVE